MKTGILLALLIVAAAASAQTTRQHELWAKSSEVRGELVRVEDTNLIVRQEASGTEPAELTIDASGIKAFIVDEESGKFEDLQPGMFLRAREYPRREGALRPTSVRASSPSLGGSVVRVDARTLIVQPTTRPAKEASVATDDQTRILLLSMTPEGRILEPRELKVGELTAGMRVRIIPPEGVARKILARAPTTVPATQP